MPSLRARPRTLNDDDLRALLLTASAVLVGTTYHLYDQAIALAVEKSIKAPGRRKYEEALFEAAHFHTKQRELPRIDTPISASWPAWGATTRDNWSWLWAQYDAIRLAYEYRFEQPAPWHREIHRLWTSSPRPRAPGRTPFPEEPC